MLKKELGLRPAVLHERLQGRRKSETPKCKTETESTSVSYLAGRGSAIQCAQRVGEQLRHASQRRVQAPPLQPLRGVVKGEDCSPQV
jgi:hypothetical protein